MSFSWISFVNLKKGCTFAKNKKIRKTVSTVMAASTIRDIPHLKKLKEHLSAYRIKLGNYRIGLFIEEDSVLFAAFEHHKDIYIKSMNNEQ